MPRKWRAARERSQQRGALLAGATAGGRALEIRAAYGRLYVSGVHAYTVQALPGAAWNEDRAAYELSLTLETLRAIKKKLGWSSAQLAACCSEEVMRWARAAGESERVVTELHRKLDTGWRQELPQLEEHYASLGERVPDALKDQLAALEKRLAG